jgi:cytoskeletal protein RodZ
MIPFYEELKQTRESLGLTIEQLSNRTKISKEIISSIETGDLNILPKTYLRLFIKAYAQEVNLDPQDILHHFEEYLGETKVPLTDPKVPNPIVVIPENNEIHENHQVDKKRNRNFATIVIILVITIFMNISSQKDYDRSKEENSIAAFRIRLSRKAIQTADTSADSQVVISQANLN